MPYWHEIDYTTQHSDFVAANCTLWAEQVGGGVTAQDVRAALYHTHYSDWNEFLAYHAHSWHPDPTTRLLHSVRILFGITPSLPDNAFVKRLLATNDTQSLHYIRLCKLYEENRHQQLDPWYYSTIYDQPHAILDSIAHLCLDYLKLQPTTQLSFPLLSQRYMLLAVRSLSALRSDDDCLHLWNECGSLLPQGPLRDEIEGFVAGCYLRTGQRNKALDIYTRLGDVSSLLFILGNAEEACELLYSHYPFNGYYRPTLQKFLYALENDDISDRYSQYELYLDSAGRNRLLNLCNKAMADTRINDKAMWCYTAAAIHDHFGRPLSALRSLQGAEVGCQDSFLCHSIRILRCYLHVKTDTVNDRYEHFLLGELGWLDSLMQQEYAAIDAADRYVLRHLDQLASTRSMLYTHDALRRILLGTDGACSRLAAAGRGIRALQLANMAEYRLFAISSNEVLPLLRTQLGKVAYDYKWNNRLSDYDLPGYIEFNPDSLAHARYIDTLSYNAHDYSNAAFMAADTMSASQLQQFWLHLVRPHDAFDTFLADKGYRDSNYWYELIGTHCLREGDYYHAVQYLRLVSPHFVRNQNISYHWQWNPFCFDRQPISALPNPKLAFAERMLWLERQLRREQDPDRLGQLLLDYSVGLRNAADRCWPLLSYGKTNEDYSCWNPYSYGYDPDWQQWPLFDYILEPERCWFNTFRCRIDHLLLADQIQRMAFLSFHSDEAAARAYHQIAFYNRVRQHYPHTAAARWIENHCDTKALWSSKQ